jgi:glycosyltransferase involved in cell wall biosynthesis
MNTKNSKFRNVILFYGGIVAAGGEEKLLFEQARYLKRKGIETHIVTYRYNSDAYGDAYKGGIEIINRKPNLKNLLLKAIYEILALRRKIKKIKPNIIIAHGSGDSPYLFFATLFTNIPYVVHVPETIFRSDKNLQRYALIHKKVFNEIRNSTVGGREFISWKHPKSSLILKIITEFYAVVSFIGIRKAKKIFVLSNQMKWEVDKLFDKGKDVIVLKGAFPSEVIDYKPKQDIKEKLGLINKKIILNVNRLDPRKRVDLVIKAFKPICDELDDVVLQIGGVGLEAERLRDLAKELNIENRVNFMGYIREEERKDYYACCDVFVHPNWADFAIAPYEALALQKKVVWSSEMEMDENLRANKHIFVADPTVNDFALAIKKALTTEVTEDDDVSMYTWEEYFDKIYDICEEVVKR